MALVQCKECKKEISDQAEVCPHCGYRHKKSELGLVFFIFGIGALIYMIGGYILGYI